jgi:large conductance mechanosensitive channel
MLKDFRSFLVKTNALALAVAFVIGVATQKLITALVEDAIMPIVEIVQPSGAQWRERALGPFRLGHLAGAFVDFVILAFVVFLISKAIARTKLQPTRACPACLEQVPIGATRCRACTGSL